MNNDVLAWQAQSLLVAYPDDQLIDRLDLLRRVAAALEEAVAAPLRRFVDHLARTPLAALAADYVATFDHQPASTRKRCCLYLTYYAHGDTRNRGMALLALKQTYAAAGLRLTDDELPDHLAVMLEYAASAAPGNGRALLIEHQAGIELLRLALHRERSPWAEALDSIAATLPALAGDGRAAIARISAQGPPQEQVGLQPYAAQGGPR